MIGSNIFFFRNRTIPDEETNMTLVKLTPGLLDEIDYW